MTNSRTQRSNSSTSKRNRQERAKGKAPHTIGRLQRGRSFFSCFLRPYMDATPAVRTRHELRELGWTYDEASELWTAPDGTEIPGERVRLLRLGGRLPGNRGTKRARVKAARRKRKARQRKVAARIEALRAAKDQARGEKLGYL